MHRIKTPIQGLEIVLNKSIGDARGWLAELVPGGTSNPDVKEGLGNVYLSVAIGKNIDRAGHYHYRQSELFFTITGAALWAFRDYREDSKTFSNIYAAIFAAEDVASYEAPIYQSGGQSMPYIVVPHGVYHVYWAITDTPVRVVCVATAPHDDNDYVRINPQEVSGFGDLVRPYGITV